MQITPRQSDHPETLAQQVRAEPNAKARDRRRCVLLAFDGLTAPQIAQRVGRSRRFVQRWCYAYRDRGLAGLDPRPQSGRPTRLAADQHDAFKQRVLAGPTEQDGVCTLRGRDMVRILEAEFGVSYSLNGVYELLRRLDLSVLKPRPRHRKSDPEAMTRWVENAPLLSSKPGSNTPANASRSGSRMKPGSGNKAG